ncbi:MAG TPA: Uma2 family endonuclease [Usitatibacter sp.]|nr:Uma2 family endonuclease [Usitatibacter sp.]
MFAMSAILDHPHKHPISAEEYLRMGEAGVFAPDARLELIDGEIIEMAPIHPPHAGRVKKLAELFFQRAGGRAIVSVQDPVITSLHSVPQPDLALLRPREDYYSRSHPGISDVFLMVEVADTTATFDLETKVPFYARCGVPEVWVVDVNERAIHVFRDAAADGYRSVSVAQVGERVACAALPEVSLEVAELFPDGAN